MIENIDVIMSPNSKLSKKTEKRKRGILPADIIENLIHSTINPYSPVEKEKKLRKEGKYKHR